MSRVLVVHHAGGIGGGTASFIDTLLMLAPDFDVHAVCPEQPAGALLLAQETGVNVVAGLGMPEFHAYNSAPGFTSRQFWAGLGRTMTSLSEWRTLLKQLRPDVVVVNSSVLAPLGLAIRQSGARAICIVRETLPQDTQRARALYASLSRLFDGVVFISDFDRRMARGRAGPSVVVRDCVRPHGFLRVERSLACRNLGLRESAFNILYTGGQSWIKGLDTALEGFSQVEATGVRLVVAGQVDLVDPIPPSATRRLRSHASKFDHRVADLRRLPYVRDHVDFVGQQSDMSNCYSSADVVLFPAAIPHQARPLIEAAHYCLPVICSDFPQYAEHAPARTTFKSGDSESLAKATRTILEDPITAVSQGQVNQAHCLVANDFETEGEVLRGFVRRILNAT